MNKENCTTCKFAKRSQLTDHEQKPIVGQYQYNCHRFPPSAFAIPNPNGGIVMASAFPVVNNLQVCSLHEVIE